MTYRLTVVIEKYEEIMKTIILYIVLQIKNDFFDS